MSDPIKRGEFIHHRITLYDNGVEITDPAGDGYEVKAVLCRADGGPEQYDLGATFADGKIAIDYQTTNLIAGRWFYDVRIILPPDSEPVWTDTYQLQIREPNTKPA